eukprot:snap_masked-scaffold_13-processed-gene-0.14-mRNA-1 protein AED:1.00 eAED:1.00 QI:0/0/0/0/1/1/2/0/658
MLTQGNSNALRRSDDMRCIIEVDEERDIEFVIKRIGNVRKYIQRWKLLVPFLLCFGFFVTAVGTFAEIDASSRIRKGLYQRFIYDKTEEGINFQTITSRKQFWHWIEHHLFPLAYSEGSWKNKTIDSDFYAPRPNLHMIQDSNLLIGGVRLAQFRASPVGVYCYESSFYSLWPHCYGNVKEATDTLFDSEKNVENITGFSYTVNKNNRGGFQVTFPLGESKLEEDRELINLLKQNKWLDERTRIVNIELSFFNVNTRLFSALDLKVLFTTEGEITTREALTVFRADIYNFHFSKNITRFIFEVLWAVTFFYEIFAFLFPVVMLRSSSKIGIGLHGFEPQMLLRGILLISYGLFVAHWASFITNETRIATMALEDTGHHDNVSSDDDKSYSLDLVPLAIWKQNYNRLVFLVLMLNTVRSVEFFQLSLKGEILVKSLKQAIPEIVSFFPIYAVFSFGFAFTGHILFGETYDSWRNMLRAYFVVFEMNFGLYDTHGFFMQQEHRLNSLKTDELAISETDELTLAFLYTVLVVNGLVLLNFFLAIIVGAFDTVTEETAEIRKMQKQGVPSISLGKQIRFVFSSEIVWLLRTVEVHLVEQRRIRVHSAVQETSESKVAMTPSFVKPSEMKTLIKSNVIAYKRNKELFLQDLILLIWIAPSVTC